MFVSELDRPWTETSFLLQGVLIDSDENIGEFQRTCEYVYVDTEQSLQSVVPQLKSLAAAPPSTTSISPATKSTENIADEEQQSFQQELKQARKIHGRTRQYIDRVLEDVRLGHSLDTETAREIVAEIAESITRSPNAMVWLTHMKVRDEYTAIHCMNVCILALNFGRCLNLSKDDLNLLGLGALLHDLGKMQVPLDILNKPARLNKNEYEVIKKHSVRGYNLIKQKGDIPQQVLNIVLSHHERIGGKGYPQGLKDNQIDLLTKITAIVDVYDAITSDRCYQDGIPPFEALKNMYEWITEDFDKELIEKFIKCLGIYPIGSMVELTTGQIGIVVSASEKSRLRPIVLLVESGKGERYTMPKLINLAHPSWSKGAQKLEVKRIIEKNESDINLPQIIKNETLI